jgi:uncharacterized membrane protein
MFSVFFMLAGLNHFRATDFYVRIMPPYLPAPLTLVYLSGLAEIALGAGLLISRLQRQAALGLIALLIAVFPANVHMAIHSELFPEFNSTLLWWRLPVQGLLLMWAYRYTGKGSFQTTHRGTSEQRRSP